MAENETKQAVPTSTAPASIGYADVTTDDGSQVQLGDTVWINHHAGNTKGPAEVTLIAVYWVGDEGWSSWPFLIERIVDDEDGGADKRVRWAKIYSTRDAAVKADPWPEIISLRATVRRLERERR